MKHKKNFNNMFDSIWITLLLLLYVVFYLVFIWFGVLNPNDGTNPIVILISCTLIFGIMIIILIVILIKGCYEYWILSEDKISSKKIFHKKINIKFTEIQKVEKKIVPAIKLGTYQSEAYIIYSKVDKIVVLANKRTKSYELDSRLAKYINK